MARSHAKFHVRAWRDDDWRSLGRDAQWLYWALLTQPKLTLVGSLEVTPAKWSNLAARTTKADIQTALDELIIAGKVLTDDTTDELLIRSFTKNDMDPNRVNVNLAKGLWGQWACIESLRLRIAAVDGMPDELWDKLAELAPPDATHIRRSARLEPVGSNEPSERAVGTPGRDASSELPPSSHLPTDTTHRPALAVRDSQDVDNSKPVTLAERAAAIGQSVTLTLVEGELNPAAGGSVPVSHRSAAHGDVS